MGSYKTESGVNQFRFSDHSAYELTADGEAYLYVGNYLQIGIKPKMSYERRCELTVAFQERKELRALECEA